MKDNKSVKTYEMQWDCPYCNTKKLLGKTHRFCPNCGAQQEADKRYYPSDDEKVAVEDHQYVGADKLCPACNTANAGDATFCSQCGSGLDGSRQARTLEQEIVQTREQFKQSKQDKPTKKAEPPPSKKSHAWLVVALIIALLGSILTVFLWTDQQTLTLTQHQWSRTIDIEDYAPRSESAWCEQLPSQAYNTSRKQEISSYRKIPDGETCHTVRADQGDGTYQESQECEPKYRDEPIYADKCYYTIDRWAYARSATSQGANLKPFWQTIKLRCEGQRRLNCERESSRRGVYEILLKNSEGKTYTCDYPEQQWRQLPKNSQWVAEVGMVLKDIRCGSLQRQ